MIRRYGGQALGRKQMALSKGRDDSQPLESPLATEAILASLTSAERVREPGKYILQFLCPPTLLTPARDTQWSHPTRSQMAGLPS